MSIIDDIVAEANQAPIRVVGDIDASPDDAARAIELSRATGVPPLVVSGDLKGFEQQHKASLAAEIVRENIHLSDFVNADPMNAKLANDDFGQLDLISRGIRQLDLATGGTLSRARDIIGAPADTGRSAFQGFIQGFNEGFGPDRWGAWVNKDGKLDINDPVQRLGASGWATLGIAPEGALRVLSGAIQGLRHAGAKGGETLYRQVTGDASGAARFGRDVGGIIEMLTDQPFQWLPPVTRDVAIQQRVKIVENAIARNRPWLERGQEPPAGFDPIFDQIKARQNELDLENLDNALDAVQESKLRERAPDIFADLIRAQTDARISIQGDALRELYGNKVPSPDDGLIGWAPQIKDQLEVAVATGGDVVVPLADWLAKVDPGVAKKLRDFIRVRPGNVTGFEGKVLASIDVYHGSPHEFDVFSMDKIGTGEGAQVYGHGLYFAENPQVSKGYQLAGARNTKRNSGEFIADHTLKMYAGNRNAAIQELKEKMAAFEADGSWQFSDWYKNYKKALEFLESGKTPNADGNLYRARIKADKEQFLDWDKPLGEQPQTVKDLWARYGDPSIPNPRGEFIHRYFEGDGPEEAARTLREAGIPGIKYLDQGSRFIDKELPKQIQSIKDSIKNREAQGLTVEKSKLKLAELEQRLREENSQLTHNYVLFDDSLVEITHKNDIPVSRDPVDNVRASAGMNPLFERKLTLQRGMDRPIDPLYAEGLHPFILVDRTGEPQVEIFIRTDKNGKEIYVEDIATLGRRGVQEFGPAAMRDVLRQLKLEFPNAEYITGMRVSGARDKAGSWESTGKVRIKLSELDDAALAKMELEWQVFHDLKGLEIGFRAGDEFTARQAEVVQVVNEEIARITGGRADTVPAEGIKLKGREVRGAYVEIPDAMPIIMFSVDATDPMKVGRHEALHFLRQQGLFSKAEWSTLMAAAVENDWIAKFDINNRYKGKSSVAKLEEAIADGFGEWRRAPEAETAVGRVFQKIAEFLDRIKFRINEIFGREVTWEDLFRAADRGDIAKREAKPLDATKDTVLEAAPKEPPPTTRMKQTEMKDMTRMEDRPLFEKAAAVGMTVDQYNRYIRAINEQSKADLERVLGQHMAREKKRQTEEWKRQEKDVREQVIEEINNRPDVAADILFREGKLYGQELPYKVRLGLDHLDPEQAKLLPNEYLAETGMHPDDLANTLGYPSGAGLIDHMIEFNAARKESGMRPADFKRRLINAEVERQMEQKYGNLQENIIESVKESVLSETQLDIIAEEVLALGLRNNAEMSISKEQMKEWSIDRLHRSSLADLSSERQLSSAAKAGKMAEVMILKGDFQGAFQAKQAQFHAILMGKEALKVEKEIGRFERQVKRFSQREVSGVAQDFTNYIQKLLFDAGLPGKMSLPEIQEGIIRGGYKTLSDFVDAKVADGWDIAITDDLRADKVTPLEKMTVGEFLDFKNTIDSLYNAGRKENRITVGERVMAFDDFRKEVIDKITQLPPRNRRKGLNWLYRFDAELTKMEEIIRDLDLREDLGPLWNAVIRPVMEAKSNEYTMMDSLAKKIGEVRSQFKGKWQKSLQDTIPQNFLYDTDGTLFDLTREHMINIMLNFGNKSNIEKFTRGWSDRKLTGEDAKLAALMMEQNLKDLFNRHATKEDWDFVQKIWDSIDFRKQITDLSYEVSGVPPKFVEAQPINTPHGVYKGGYYPIIYDKWRSGIAVVKEKTSADSLFGGDYFRASTPHGYANERTGYIDYVQFENSIEQIATRLQQTIHDLAYRKAVMNVSKVVYDKEIRNAIRNHYGPEYEAQLTPWLRDVANHFNMNEQAVGFMNSVLRRARMNLMVNALGYNLKVIMSPSLGKLAPWEAARMAWLPEGAWDLAHSKSLELPHTLRSVDRDYREHMEQAIAAKGWSGIQADAARWSMLPMLKVEQRLRVMSWVTEYQESLGKGRSEADAIALADRAVRERHGAAGTPDLAAIMRSNEAMKLATVFYGYFSTMYNWQRQLPGNVKRGEWMEAVGTAYGAILVPTFFGALLFNQRKKDEGLLYHWSKSLLLTPLSTMVLVREFANWMLEGYPPRSPIESIMMAVGAVTSDVKKWRKGQKIEKPIQHGANAVGLTLGLPLGQAGRTGQFLSDVANRQQHPRNILEWGRGIVHGEAQPKR